MGMTPQHFYTIPTFCAILPPLTQICFMIVCCVQRRVVEGSGVGSAIWVCSACWVCMVCWSLNCYGSWTWQILINGRLWSKQCWAPCSISWEFCGVHSWQNGTRCKDGVKVLRCHSHLVWMAFEGSIPRCALFLFRTFLWLVSVAFL